MKNNHDSLALYFSIAFVIFLALPALGYFFHFAPGKELFGYVEMKTAQPEKLIPGWLNKTLQPHIEEVVNQKIGFRAAFIRFFNDLNFRLFSEHPHSDIYATKEHGLYFKYSIAHLNNEYLYREKLSQEYDVLAKKLAEIQGLLAAKGKHFEVIISSSKPYLHLEGLGSRFLVNTNNDIYDKTASLGRSLQNHGVHVIDSGPILREFYKKKAVETHAYSGVHWNYYAGCVIAKQLFNDIRKTFSETPSIHCGSPSFQRAKLIDRDGHLLINILSNAKLVRKSPYPNPSASFSGNYRPNMLIVGDSFMHQIIDALDQAKSYSKITISSYFRTHINHTPNEPLLYEDPTSQTETEEAVLKAALEKDIIILQMVDYNIIRKGYGFVEALLTRLKEETHET